MKTNHTSIAFAVTILLMTLSAQAQVIPDAGQTLQQLAPKITAPAARAPLQFQPPVATEALLPGGQKVVLKSVVFSGNSVLTSDALAKSMGEVAGKEFDLAGLQVLADRITAVYVEAGHPFARAYLPAKGLKDGNLKIEVIEGRFGRVKVSAEDAAVAARAERFLGDLKTGEVISNAQLERSILILSDLPGVKVLPVIAAGTDVGTGDLTVEVSPAARVFGDVGLDNFGNRYTGQYRAHANLTVNTLFTFGDQIRVQGLVSDEMLWLGSASYSLPLNDFGLRGNVGYAHTSYQLGREFADLHANGTAKVSSVGLTYPLLRSEKTNVTLGVSLLYKKLQDNRDAVTVSESKRSSTLPLSVQFDHRDKNGIMYGNLAWTSGSLKLDNLMLDPNKTRGHFSKLNLDLVRHQALPNNFSLYGRFAGQWAEKNLDSSESFSVGGPAGVRSYAAGEAGGDSGWLTQMELRYQAENFAPYGFFDAGGSKINALPKSAEGNKRSLSGAGVGVRFAQNGWNVDAALAWRTSCSKSQSDNSDKSPRVWVTAGYQF